MSCWFLALAVGGVAGTRLTLHCSLHDLAAHSAVRPRMSEVSGAGEEPSEATSVCLSVQLFVCLGAWSEYSPAYLAARPCACPLCHGRSRVACSPLGPIIFDIINQNSTIIFSFSLGHQTTASFMSIGTNISCGPPSVSRLWSMSCTQPRACRLLEERALVDLMPGTCLQAGCKRYRGLS
jgi:hypothetical protein